MTANLRRDALTADLFVRALRRYRSRPVVHVGADALVAGEVADEISRLLQVFDQWRLGPGSRVAMLSPNRPEVLLAMGAALVGGLVWTPLHPLGSLEDHAFVLTDAEVDVLLYDGAAFGGRAAELLARVPSLRRAVPLTPDGERPDLASAAAAFGARSLSAAKVAPDDVSSVMYTGGTTGTPKGVVTTHRGLTAMTTIELTEWEWPSALRMLCVTPLSHAAGALFVPTILRGGSLYVLPAFDPPEVLDAIARHRITATMLVPTMIYRLLDDPALDSSDTSCLELLLYGAAPMSSTRLAEGIDRLGPKFFQFYGQSECPMTITVLGRTEHSGDRLGSCGRPVPWLDVSLLDGEGHEVAAGEAGEICVRGPLVMAGYHRRPDLTSEVLRDGWLHTGDIARADDDGYLTIVDRSKDMVVTGGFNVFPREVEDVIATHEAVAAVAVIGVPDDRWGEAVKAIVVPRPGAVVDTAALVQLVKERKGGAAAPKSVELVESIPLTPLGKPDKKALRARYWRQTERQVS